MPNKINITWEDVDQRAHVIMQQCSKHTHGAVSRLYGIPRGGYFAVMAVARAFESHGLPARIVDKPENADFLIDDIIDTGNTKLRFERMGHKQPFYGLVDKLGRDKGNECWVVFPWEVGTNEEDGPTENIVRLLEYIGDDPEREGLLETPERVIKSYGHLFGGYNVDPNLLWKVFEDDKCDEMVVLKDIEFYSTCEHHMLPFFGRAHIAYIPRKRVVGISKLARVLEMYARRLQIQERLCQQITMDMDKFLKPLGSACVLEAQHFCMTSRGVEKQNSVMVTSSLTGVFKDETVPARQEFLRLIGK